MVSYDPDLVRNTQTSAGWSVVTRGVLDEVSGSVFETWDRDLLREPRVLVPMDVQALVVTGEPSGAAGTAGVAMPGPLAPGQPEDPALLDGPDPFVATKPRPRGVHLHWAMPDALLRGSLRDPRGEPGGGLGLAALPDRFAVLRLSVPTGADEVRVRGWLVDAATGTVRDLEAGTSGPALPGTGARVLTPSELTGTAGGTLTWTGAYDASFARFGWLDPLDDLAGVALVGGAVSYSVVGWWSLPDLDPLDGVRTEGGLAELTASLGWRLVDGGGGEHLAGTGPLGRLADLGLPVASRYGAVAEASFSRAAPIGQTLPSTVTGRVVTQAGAAFADEADLVLPGSGVATEASTLVHGSVVGVLLPGQPDDAVRAVDLRPDADEVEVLFGEHVDDLVAAAIGRGDRALERLLTAFSARLLARFGSADGVVDVDQHEHARGFASQSSREPPVVDRVLSRAGQIPPRASHPQAAGLRFISTKVEDRVFGYLRTESTADTVARSNAISSPLATFTGESAAAFSASTGAGFTRSTGSARAAAGAAAPPASTPPTAPAEGEQVARPVPPRYVPLDPAIAFSGIGRNLRHGGDGRGSADGRLRCRRGSQVVRGYAGMLEGSDVLGSLGSGAVPSETLALARETVLLSPHLLSWLVSVSTGETGTRAPGLSGTAATARLAAEHALRYDATGAYTGAAGPKAAGGAGSGYAGGIVGRGDAHATASTVQEILRRHSMLVGVEPDLVAVTAWAQPWIPMWVEYEVAVDVAADTGGWALGAVDLEPAGVPPAVRTRVVTGRTPLTTAPGDTVAAAVSRWLVEETQRDLHDAGEAEPATQQALAALARDADGLDLVGAALDGVRRALLGLGSSAVRPRTADGTTVPPTPDGLPDLLTAGTVTLNRVRVVDSYGRTLDVPVDAARVPARLVVRDSPDGPVRPGVLRHSPRFTPPARCRLRLVDAAALAAVGAVDARVDEVEPAQQVSPVCGFLLPDHVDESVEVFTAAGVPLGELLTEPTSGGVVWEPAPGSSLNGQAVPADAPPGLGLSADAAPLGWLAAGMVSTDVAARTAAGPEGLAESALAAFLRAMDTTLWTSDPYAGAGTSALAGIVGRPVAVVRAVLTLDVADDLAELTLDGAASAQRARAFAELAGVEVPVRIGELTRSDDGLLGYVLDDDFTRVHVVDRVVLDLAREAGRGRGHLRPWGETPVVPEVRPIRHPYLVQDVGIRLRPGVPRLVTLLMLPGSSVHVTSGVIPRTRVSMARSFFADALAALVPSVRVGPVLVDPGDVRLPPVAAFGERQVLTYRESPLSWRDDPILAATQDALLPDHASVLREGWLRVDPSPPPEPGGAT